MRDDEKVNNITYSKDGGVAISKSQVTSAIFVGQE